MNGSSKIVLINCVLDMCSSDCWGNEKLLNELGISSQSEIIDLTTMHHKSGHIKTNVINNLEICDVNNCNKLVIPVVYCKSNDSWPFSKSDIPSYDHIEKYSHLKEIPFEFLNSEILLLIGMSAFNLMKPLQLIHSENDSDPCAMLTPLGWALIGSIIDRESNVVNCNNIIVKDQNGETIENYFESVFSRDFIDDNGNGYSQNDLKFLSKINSSIRLLESGHYEIELPFKTETIDFPSNRGQAFNRFVNLTKRFDRDIEYFAEYSAFMNMMLENDFAEEIPVNDLVKIDHDIWYLCHHGVFHKVKKTIRVVFNCSLRYNGISLNDALLAGPDLTNSLFGVLLRFRSEQFAITSDIVKMFYQVRVPSNQRDFLRFFWYDSDSKIKEFRLKVHLFGAKSSPSVSNFALKRTGEDAGCSSEIAETINKCFYVDDFLYSNNSEKNLVRITKEVERAIKVGGFELSKYNSNSPMAREIFVTNSNTSTRVAPSCTVNDTINDSVNEVREESALGIIWNTDCDTIKLKWKLLVKDFSLSKRKLLKGLASVFDPLGLVNPVVVKGKILFQQSCKLKLDWDSKLPDDLITNWNKWIEDVNDLSLYSIPRCTKHCPTRSIELHTFCDGSVQAYGAVSYMRYVYENETISVSMVASKSRLTPINNSTLKTIPRIELASAKLGIELSNKIKAELTDLSSFYFYTDSTSVLNYIKNEDKRFKRFVCNKVNFIRGSSSPLDWHYVPSKVNPADLISRGCSVKSLSKSDLWQSGPSFLSDSTEINFPSVNKYTVDNCDDEVISESKVLQSNLKIVEKNILEDLMISCSNWTKLVIRIAWLLKLKYCMKNKVSLKNAQITTFDHKLAEKEIIKFWQIKLFKSEINALQCGKCVRKTSPIYKLCPFIDNDGLLRVGGRIHYSNLNYNAKHPILIPSNTHLAELLLNDAHIAMGHLGRQTILCHLRRKYWLIKGNSMARKLVHNCITCRRLNGRPLNPKMSDLPVERVLPDDAAFSKVGIDFFGPFETTICRKTNKRYGVIFSCLNSRAIHIETAYSLSTDSCINAIRRFIARRGNVTVILCDNGTNLKSSEKEMKKSIEEWNSEKIEKWLKQKQITWKFIPPTGSHFGGCYEREIRSIRKVMNALLREQPLKLSDEELNTIFCEVESILNNRPITHVSSDPNDLSALTPNNILLLNAGVTLPPGVFKKDSCYVHRRWRQVQYLVNLFWSRWKREYMVNLCERQKWVNPKKQIDVNDMVLVTDLNLPRNQWPLGRVVKTNADKRGVVRSAQVKVSKCKNGPVSQFSCTILERPVSKLIVLNC